MKTPKNKQMIAIERLRNERGLSQKELSKIAGVSVRWYQKLLDMDYIPQNTIAKLSTVLNVDISNLTSSELDNLLNTTQSSMFLPIYPISSFTNDSMNNFTSSGLTLPTTLFKANKGYICLCVDTLDYIPLGYETNDLLFVEKGLLASVLFIKNKDTEAYSLIKKCDFTTSSHELVGGVIMTLCKAN